MGVAAEIGEHLLWAAEGRFGVDDPFDLAQAIEVTGEGSGFGEAGKLTEEAEFAGLEGGPQFVEEQTAEKAGEHADRQKEARTTGDPALAVERWAAAWHDAWPQVWSTARRPISAPRCRGSAAMVRSVSAALRNRMA